ncbi:MAG TPA: diguanylate cyclase [Syntrophomonadaceae bacterium]|nr:diguanylate cyclase [Syntrophomonadaceae bacterium]
MNNPKILVIDDEKSIRDLLKSALSEEGYHVLVAFDGLDGYEKAIEHTPDLILLDIMMPDIDGFEVLQRLKREDKTANIPIIFLTAKVDGEERVAGLEAGAVDYIIKPFYLREVMARIKIHLKLKKYEAELEIKNQELQDFSDLLLELNTKLEEMARKDGLTRIWNRRAFNEQIIVTHNYSKRYEKPYTIIMADLDHFKNYNDIYGHQQGDVVLQKVSKAINDTCRITDFVARYGGEEIVIILPNTNQKDGFESAERVIEAIRQLKIPHANNEGFGIVTISAGVFTYSPTMSIGWSDVIKGADDALYKAKNSGRNTVCV